MTDTPEELRQQYSDLLDERNELLFKVARLQKAFAPLANLLCELVDDPQMTAEMEKDFERWRKDESDQD
jgi:hypothetical protein